MKARDVSTDPAEEAGLLESVATAELNIGRYEAAEAHLRDTVARWDGLGDRLASARTTRLLGRTLAQTGRLTEAMPIVVAAEAAVADLAPHPVVVELWLGLAAGSGQLGDREGALRWADKALADAERLSAMELVAQGMVTKGGILSTQGRPVEGRALLEAGLRLAEEIGDGVTATRAAHHLSLALMDDDPRAALSVTRQAFDLANRYGLAPLRLSSLGNAIEASLSVGDWGWLVDELGTIRLDELEPADRWAILIGTVEIESIRGRDVSAPEADVRVIAGASSDPMATAATALAFALARTAEGRWEDAYREALVTEQDDLNAPYGLMIAARAAIRLGDAERAREVLDRLDARGARGAAGRAIRDGLMAALDALRGNRQAAMTGLRDAWARMRELGIELALGMSQLDYLAVAPSAEPLADEGAREARSILERAGALAYLRQLDELEAERGGAGASITEAAVATEEAVTPA